MPNLASRTTSLSSADKAEPRWFSPRRFGWSYRDLAGIAVAGGGIGAIVVNALFMQSGPHPAPIFASVMLPVAAVEARESATGVVPNPAPRLEPTKKGDLAKPEPPVVAPKSAAETITEIQRELARRGFYDGSVDGLYGSKTDAAIRDFEHTAGLKPSAEPNVALLRAIKTSNTKAGKSSTIGTGAGRPTPPAPIPSAPMSSAPVPPAPIPVASAPPARNDPINDALAPSKRIVAVQRALADYGYGQIRPSGMLDRETKTAIERFERERKLPVTGAVSDRLTRELAAVTGRPLE